MPRRCIEGGGIAPRIIDLGTKENLGVQIVICAAKAELLNFTASGTHIYHR